MSVDSILDDAFSTLLAKALRPGAQPALRPASVNFKWGGGGAALNPLAMDPAIVEIPFPGRLVWVHLYAGDGLGNPVPVDATFNLQLTQLAAFGGSVPLYGTAAPPSLFAQASADVPLTGWYQTLDAGDTLIATVTTFVGAATWLAMTLQFRPTDAPIGVATVVNNAGSTMVNNAGQPLVFFT